MEFTLTHDHAWDVTPAEAKAIQRELAPEVRAEPLAHSIDGGVKGVQTVAGLDVSIRGDLAQAAVSVVRLRDFAVVDEAVHRCEVPFPYVPGLLSFREMPAVLPALRQLAVRPDVLMTDSQGLAHPRRFGLGCHVGVLLDWPTLGVAKTRLTGRPEGDLGDEKGDYVPLVDDEADDSPETIGAVVRTRTNVKPVFVSLGHRLTLADAVALTLRCCPRYKIPEPTRQAHRLSRREEA